jgi:hypothetical protein
MKRKTERQLLSHNLKNPSADDWHAAELIREIYELLCKNRNRMRQPTLAL